MSDCCPSASWAFSTLPRAPHEYSSGHRVRRPRGTGSVGDSVGEGACTSFETGHARHAATHGMRDMCGAVPLVACGVSRGACCRGACCRVLRVACRVSRVCRWPRSLQALALKNGRALTHLKHTLCQKHLNPLPEAHPLPTAACLLACGCACWPVTVLAGLWLCLLACDCACWPVTVLAGL